MLAVKYMFRILKCTFVIALFSIGVSLKAQFKYNKSGYIEFKKGQKTIENPFLGGFNSPQFQMMDLNEDGKEDLIVFDRNDYKIATFLKISGDYFKYSPEYEHYFPDVKFLLKLADLNSDGKMDLFTCQETGELIIYLNQTTIPGKLKFKNLGPQYFRNQHDTSFYILYNSLSFANMKTDLPEIKDLDNDGDIDIMVYDAQYLTYTMYKDVRAEKGWSKDTFEFQNMDYCFGYFWEGFDNKIRLNMCYLQSGGSNFKAKLRPRHVGGASCWFNDDDRDGDYEMYLANVGSKKISKLTNGKADFKNEYDTMIQVDTMFPQKNTSFNGFVFPAGYMIHVDSDTLSDLILAPNGISDVKETEQIWYYHNKGTPKSPDYELVKKDFIAEKTLDFGAKSAPAFLDVDNDGDLDLLVSSNGDYEITYGLKDVVALYTNVGTNKEPKYIFTTSNFLPSDSSFQSIIPSTGDIDNDGDIDVLLGTSKGKIVWYENIAGPNKPVNLKYNTNDLLKYQNVQSETNFAPEIFDYNQDGIQDLIIGMYNGHLAYFEGQTKVGTPTFTWKTSNAWGARANLWRDDVNPTGFESYGYAVPRVADLNNDGIKELVVGTFFGKMRLYHINNHSMSDSLIADESMLYQNFGKDTFVPKIGFRLTHAFADLDGDSIPEMFIGMTRGGIEFAKSDFSKVKIGLTPINTATFNVNIYPNPANSQFVIQLPPNSYSWKVSAFSSAGSLIYKSSINRGEKGLSVKCDWDTGIYIIQLQNEFGQTISKKLLIHK